MIDSIDKPAAAAADDVKKNKDFIQLYRKCLAEVGELVLQQPKAAVVFFFLAKHMDGRNAIVVSLQMIADHTNMSRQTVAKQIDYLTTHGWIQIFKSGRSRIYVLNPSIVWSSYNDEKQYCRFEASVMLAPSEMNWDIAYGNTTHLKQLTPTVMQAMIKDLDTKNIGLD